MGTNVGIALGPHISIGIENDYLNESGRGGKRKEEGGKERMKRRTGKRGGLEERKKEKE